MLRVSHATFVAAVLAFAPTTNAAEDRPGDLKSTKSWSKEELNLPPPEFSKNLGDRVFGHFSSFASSLTDRKTKGDDPFLKWHEETRKKREDYKFSFRTLNAQESPSEDLESKKFFDHFQGETRTIVSDKVKNLEPVKKWLDGFNFKLDFTSKKSRPAVKPRVSYGLVLTSIVEEKPASLQAATASIEEELQFAGQSKPVWTIGPIDEQPIHLTKVQLSSNDKTDKSWLEKTVKAPSPNILINVKPVESSGESTDGANTPSVLIELKQEDGLYTYSKTVATAKDGAESERHKLALPIIGPLNAMRIYDEKFKPVETGLENVFFNPYHTATKLTINHNEEKFIQQTDYAFGRHKVQFKSQSPVANAGKTSRIHESEYSLGYQTYF